MQKVNMVITTLLHKRIHDLVKAPVELEISVT